MPATVLEGVSVTPDDTSFDYIICGGGTSGSVIAGRLAETPNVSVLVIEAGRHNSLIENTQMVGGWSQNFGGEDDWNLETEPSPGLNGRRVAASRGKYLGGSTGCNGSLCIRGTKDDFNKWELEGWSGDEVFSYMNKVLCMQPTKSGFRTEPPAQAETFHSKPWFDADLSNHGTTGPLHTEPHDLAPISKLLLQSFESQGLRKQDDMFSSGNNPHGCGHAPRTVHQGMRSTAAGFLRKSDANLAILTETTVDKVILTREGGGEIKASAVRIIDKAGNARMIDAKREVIVSAGAYCTPAILLRSGIGAAGELEQLGIECKVDLSGVGKNLLDHLIVFLHYEVSKPNLTTDALIHHPSAYQTSYTQWKTHKTGFLSTFPFGAFAYARLDNRLASSPLWTSSLSQNPGRDPMDLLSSQPHVEFFTTECYLGNKTHDFPSQENQHAFALIVQLFSPRSRGTVSIKGGDCTMKTVIDHNYLGEGLDAEVLGVACEWGNEIVMEGKGTRGVAVGGWPRGSRHHLLNEREEWKVFVREQATTGYHPAGTAKMGKDDDAMAVLDERLRVRRGAGRDENRNGYSGGSSGAVIRGFRVADCSVMPELNCGHTQMVAYAVGEKCADMIKEDWGDGVGGS